MYKLLFIIPLCFLTVHAKNEEYEGHTLYQVNVENLEQVELLKQLEEQYTLDFWNYAAPGREGMVLVPRDLRQVFQRALYDAGITYKVAVQNIKESIDLEDQLLADAGSARTNRSRPGLSFDRIHRFQVVDNYLVELGRRFPNTVRVVSGGRSVEGRNIRYLRISTTNFQDVRKPVIFMMSLLHAREWITLPATLYAIHKLVVDVTERDVLNNIDWIILPIANPDGYEFSHTNSRFWRKNRRTNISPGNRCIGVDPNRNFDAFWGTASSNNPCSDTFQGSHAFSEPETQIVRNIIRSHRNRLEMYLDIHSFGSMILFGFGTGQLAPNALTLNVVGGNMARRIDAVRWRQNRNYVVGNIVAVLQYRGSGGSSDFAQLQNVGLSYTFELPSYRNNVNNINGFLVNPAFIEQAGFETWEGIKVGARWVVRNTRAKLQRKSNGTLN